MKKIEKLRSMTAEEIAKVFTNATWDGKIIFICPVQEKIGEGECACRETDCRECFLAWLNEEED